MAVGCAPCPHAGARHPEDRGGGRGGGAVVAAHLAQARRDRAARPAAARARARARLRRAASRHSMPAHPLGKLLDARHREPQLLARVPAPRGGALPLPARARAHAPHESLDELLASGGIARAGLPAARSRAARRLAHGPAVGVQDIGRGELPDREVPAAQTSELPPPKPFVDLSDEAVHWDLSGALSYGQYLNLDKLLDAQHPLSSQHDEMLFIIIHQVSELWMKLCLHELTATVACIRRDDLGPTFKMLTRVSTIQEQLLQAWNVLATVTPSDYSAFRNALGRSSGFQSAQYRLLEFLIGNKHAEMIQVFKSDPAAHQMLERALRAP